MHILHVIVEFAIVLGIMVLVHELGHFAVAKWCGVRVEAFSIGFGPRLFGFRIGDTDYRLSLLPLGGYVKMSGETPGEPHSGDPANARGVFQDRGETSSNDPGDFSSHPRWQRTLIAFAGPVANFILSFFLMAAIAHWHYEVPAFLNGPAVVDYVPQNSSAARAGLSTGDTITQFSVDKHPDWESILNDCMLNLNHDVPFSYTHNGELHTGTVHVVPSDKNSVTADPIDEAATGLIPREQLGPISVTDVQGGSPAERAGLKKGDLIDQVDGFQPHSVPALLAYLRDRNGAATTLQVSRGTQHLTLIALPEKMDVPNAAPQFRLGFSYQRSPTQVQRLPLGQAFKQSVKDNARDSTLVGRILKGMFTRHVAVKSLSGPVGIAQQIDLAWQYGNWVLLGFMSTISLQLGIFNLLPIPLLDGGMIVFLLIESAIRRDLDQTIKERVYQVAFICLILFAAFVMFNDIMKLHK